MLSQTRHASCRHESSHSPLRLTSPLHSPTLAVPIGADFIGVVLPCTHACQHWNDLWKYILHRERYYLKGLKKKKLLWILSLSGIYNIMSCTEGSVLNAVPALCWLLLLLQYFCVHILMWSWWQQRIDRSFYIRSVRCVCIVCVLCVRVKRTEWAFVGKTETHRKRASPKNLICRESWGAHGA